MERIVWLSIDQGRSPTKTALISEPSEGGAAMGIDRAIVVYKHLKKWKWNFGSEFSIFGGQKNSKIWGRLWGFWMGDS
jgi:hypothetical protein